MHILDILNQFSSKVPLERFPEKNEGGFYLIQIKNCNPIFVKELDPGIFFQTLVTPIIEKKSDEALFIYLMKANLLGQGTGKAALGIDESENFFALSQTFPYAVHQTSFYDTIEMLLNYADFWKKELNNLQQQNGIL